MRIFRVLIFIFLCLGLSSCTWLALLDTTPSSPRDRECEKTLVEEQKKRQYFFTSKLMGYDKSQIKNELGNPKSAYLRQEYTGQHSVDGKKVFSDESWWYYYTENIPSCGNVSYSLTVYFLNGSVIAVK